MNKEQIAGLLILVATTAMAERFALLQTNPPAFYGAFDFKHGETIVIGTNVYTLALLNQEPSFAEKKAKTIVFPLIEFRDAALTDVIRFFQENARQYDPNDAGVNIVNKASKSEVFGPNPSRRITVQLRRISFYDALRYSVEVAGLELTGDDNALIIQEKMK